MDSIAVTPQIILVLAASAVIAYLLGSISFAVIFSRLFVHDDVRNHGSGNAGVTNVFRSVGLFAGLCTFLCDFGKGAAAILVSRLLLSAVGLSADAAEHLPLICIAENIAGLGALLGHLYPVFFGFRGGKGIAIMAGIIFILSPIRFAALVVLFLIVFLLTRTVSVGSVIAAIAYPIITFIHCWFFQRVQQPGIYTTGYVAAQVFIAAMFGLIVLIKHRVNIMRILDGTEPKSTVRKKPADPPSEGNTDGAEVCAESESAE